MFHSETLNGRFHRFDEVMSKRDRNVQRIARYINRSARHVSRDQRFAGGGESIRVMGRDIQCCGAPRRKMPTHLRAAALNFLRGHIGGRNPQRAVKQLAVNGQRSDIERVDFHGLTSIALEICQEDPQPSIARLWIRSQPDDLAHAEKSAASKSASSSTRNPPRRRRTMVTFACRATSPICLKCWLSSSMPSTN